MHREQSVKREKTNKIQLIRCLLSTLSQHVSGINMPIFSRTKTVCYCIRCLCWFCWMWLVAVVGRCVVGCEHCEGYWGASTLKVTASRTVTFTVLAPHNTAPHNRYQPHPAEPAQHTTCSNTRLGLLKMGIMMPEIVEKVFIINI